jgi:hypothetical protein
MTFAMSKRTAVAAILCASCASSNSVTANPPCDNQAACTPDAGSWPPSGRRICDGSSGLRFATRIPVTGNVDLLASLQYELGENFVFIDGTCHYWAMAWGNTDPLGQWGAIHDGVLDENTERALVADSLYGDWDNLAGAWGSTDTFDAGLIVFHDRMQAISCVSPCDKPGPTDDAARFGQVQHLYGIQQTWVEKLYQQAAPSTGPMRISVFAQRDNAYPGVQRVPWPLGVGLDTVVDDPLSAGVGRSHLIDAPGDTASLRDLRRKLVTGQLGVTIGLIAIENDQNPSAPYPLYARDAIPALEDSQGLISLPPAMPGNAR